MPDDLLGVCQENLVHRCDVIEGITRGPLCRFQYFGVRDEVDYRNIRGRGLAPESNFKAVP